MVMIKITAVVSLVLSLALLAICGCSSGVLRNPNPLGAGRVNLIFVVSEDLAFQASGDVNPTTANLTNQGLQRSLLMATFLKQRVLGTENASGIYALDPMTHLQTANNYPDMVALETIQQFAMLNRITLSTGNQGWVPFTADSFPLNGSYAAGPLPTGVAAPLLLCPACQGLDFTDPASDNESLVTGIVTANIPGVYVFSAPWETTSTLLASVNTLEGFNLTVPASYQGPNFIYAISISPTGDASLVTYNSNITPLQTYPVLPSPVPVSATCTEQKPFQFAVTAGIAGAELPMGMNTNETFYMVRHAEAHPQGLWDDGNYVAAGQWRALDLPNALKGKISPDQVWSIDPAQVIPGTEMVSGNSYWSYVRPSLTVEPYAIANNLPYYLAASFPLISPDSPQETIKFFFTGNTFSGQALLLAWEHEHFAPTVNALVASYFPHAPIPSADVAPDWPDDDYDTVWTVTFDATGNFTVNNATCEGIKSAALPSTAPQF